jgi:predicted ATPase
MRESEAEAHFRRAITLSAERQSKSLELRAAMSLSRLLRNQGKHAEAHTLLASIYNWFTEGLGTKDLKDAKVLLEELAIPGAT